MFWSELSNVRDDYMGVLGLGRPPDDLKGCLEPGEHPLPSLNFETISYFLFSRKT
jgi:hypothetical protein